MSPPGSNSSKGSLFQNLFGTESGHPANPRQLEELQDLLSDTSTVIGLDFLRMLTRRLTKLLQVRYCLISQVALEKPSHLRTVAAHRQGQELPEMEYELRPTPCKLTVEKGFFYCPSDLIAKFPDDHDLQAMEVSSYLGITLNEPSGETLGVFCILHEHALPDPDFAKRVLQLFSLRVTAELDRMRSHVESDLANQRLQVFAREVPGWVFVYEDHADGTRKILYTNDGLKSLVGPKTAAWVMANNSDFGKIIHPEDRERVSHLHEMQRRENVANWTEYRVRIDDGSYRQMRVNRRFSGEDMQVRIVHGIMLDDDNRFQLERQRAELFNQFSRLLEAIPFAVIMKDGLDRLQLLNPAALQLLQLESVDWKDKRFSELAEVVPSARLVFIQSEAQDQEAWAMKERLESKETLSLQDPTRQLSFEVTRIPLFQKGGERMALVTILRDVTQRLAEQKRRKELEQSYHSARRMEAMGSMANGVAHEFENSLTAVLGYTEICLSDLKAATSRPNKLRDSLLKIQTAGENASGVARSLLAFGRLGGEQSAFCNPPQVLQELRESFLHLAGNRNSFEFEVEDEDAQIQISKADLAEIVVHLVTNARQALPTSGKIGIRGERRTFQRALTLHKQTLAPGLYYMLEISDTGLGIPAHELDRVFDPFYTTSGAVKGRGHGLSIVYGMVKDVGGGIDIVSGLGPGTRFRIYLPIEEQTSSTAKDKQRPVVLLVEDQAAILKMIQTILQASDLAVVPCANLGEARAAVHDGLKPDLLLIDVLLPDGNGPDFARELLDHHANLRVLYCSGVPAANLAGLGIHLEPGTTLIEKPFRPTYLMATVQRCLEGRPLAKPSP